MSTHPQEQNITCLLDTERNPLYTAWTSTEFSVRFAGSNLQFTTVNSWQKFAAFHKYI